MSRVGVIFDRMKANIPRKRFLLLFALLMLALLLFAACASEEQELLWQTDLLSDRLVTEEVYEFHAVVYNADGSLCSLEVFCGGEALSGENGRYQAHLLPGENEIVLRAADHAVKEERSYLVTYRADLVIDTDCQTAMVINDKISFSAQAFFNDTPCALSVTHNGAPLQPTDGADYEATLSLGDNRFDFTARSGSHMVEKSVSLRYEGFTLISDLADSETNNAAFSFRAKARYGEEDCDLSVTCNGVAVTPVGNRYDLALNPGDNTVVIRAFSGAMEKYSRFTLRFLNAQPTLWASLNESAVYRSSFLSFDVKATDGLGGKLPPSALDFAIDYDASDGIEDFKPLVGLAQVWDDDVMTGFRLDLKKTLLSAAGRPVVLKITAETAVGSVSQSYRMVYEPAETGETIGEIVFSLEGFTVGKGFFIAPCLIPIREGQNFAALLTELLEAHGFSYHATGQVNEGFYLAAIGGLDLDGNAIPSPLWERLSGQGYERTLSPGGTLGEFDYGSGSGWMYAVNGIYKNYGFSDYYPQDGDVVRVQFTLALGADIGGGHALGGASDDWMSYHADYAPLLAALAKVEKANPSDDAVYRDVLAKTGVWDLPEATLTSLYDRLLAAYAAILS